MVSNGESPFNGQLEELHTLKESEAGSHWYFKLAADIKDKFQDQKNLSAPEISSVNSLTDLFVSVNQTAEPIWEEAMKTSLDDAFLGYESKSQAGKDFLLSLGDKDMLIKGMMINRNWQFDALRKNGDEEMWFTLFLAISEREQLKSRVLLNYVDQMSHVDEQRLGISKEELRIFAGLNLELQPHIDQAYVKQMIISGGKGKESKNPKRYHAVDGTASLYITDDGSGTQIHTFKEVFPTEMIGINQVLKKYAKIVRRGVKTQNLGIEYKDLPQYLNKLGSYLVADKESLQLTDDSGIGKLHLMLEECGLLCAKLSKKGCPIIVNPLGFVPEEGDRIDIELLVGITLGEKSEWHQDSQKLVDLALNKIKKMNLPKSSIVPFIHQFFLAINGSNITYTCLAAVGDGYISFNDGRHKEIGKDRYGRFYHLMNNETTLAKFTKAVAIGTMTHELGHLFRYLDQLLNLKLGTNINTNKLDELKADCVGTILFKQYYDSGQTDVTREEYIEQYLLNYVDDINDAHEDPSKDISPTWYAFDGKTIIVTLLENNAIDWVDGKFNIIDGKAGVDALARLGEEILNKYKDPNFRQEQVEEYVKTKERLVEQNPNMKEFLDKIELDRKQAKS